MKVVSGGRGTGKTAKMIDWLFKHEDGVLIVATEERRRYLADKYDPIDDMGIRNRIQTAQIWINRPASFYHTEVVIDDADEILNDLFGRVKMFSMRYEEGDEWLS